MVRKIDTRIGSRVSGHQISLKSFAGNGKNILFLTDGERQHGHTIMVSELAIEMHPGFCVYNPETLLSLCQTVGENIRTNFDPSHLFWQGIDPIAYYQKATSRWPRPTCATSAPSWPATDTASGPPRWSRSSSASRPGARPSAAPAPLSPHPAEPTGWTPS